LFLTNQTIEQDTHRETLEKKRHNITSGVVGWDMRGSGSDPSTEAKGGMKVNQKPAWLERLMGETFFGGCGVHKNQRKNEKNILCLHCCLTICPHCLPSHPSHPLLQVLVLYSLYLHHHHHHLNSLLPCFMIIFPSSVFDFVTSVMDLINSKISKGICKLIHVVIVFFNFQLFFFSFGFVL